MNTHTKPPHPALPQLLAWVENIDLPIFVVVNLLDDRLEFLHANAALSHVTKMPATTFPGRSPSEIFPTRIAARLEANYRSCLRSNESFSYEECLLIEGAETWWQTTLTKAAGFDGTVLVGVAIPITERKEREFAAADMISNMADRFDELRLFSTIAAHDARSPLATVASLVELVRSDFADMGDGKMELLDLVSDTVAEALEQITATLERAKSLRTGNDTNRQFDLGRVCGDIAAMVDPEMSLEITVPEAIVECDDVIVQMGVRNLMANAARHCRSRIEVSVAEDTARGMVWIEVADDGPGLPADTSLQDLTTQGEAREGTHGFGVNAITKLVHNRGGSFELVSSSTSLDLTGARFRMALPGKVLAAAGAQAVTEGTAQRGSVGLSL